jgi:hypothetical protein
MKCPKCQFENREGIKFCEKCGLKMELVCDACGAKLPPDRQFCGECGHDLTLPSKPISKELSFEEKLVKIQRYLPKDLTQKILAQRDRIEGERKQVTVMFCDMEGYTSLTAMPRVRSRLILSGTLDSTLNDQSNTVEVSIGYLFS